MQIDLKMIPPEVVEAAARAAHDVWRRQASVGDDIAEYAPWHEMSADLQDEYLDQARAAIAAALAAWPGAYKMLGWDEAAQEPRYEWFLPLPQQASDDQ
jgi:hypothetical protein